VTAELGEGRGRHRGRDRRDRDRPLPTCPEIPTLIRPAGAYAEAAVMLGPSLQKRCHQKKKTEKKKRHIHMVGLRLGRVWLANDRLRRRGILQLGKPVR
jgi:hypothetical protein